MAIYFVTSSQDKFAEARAIIPSLERLEIDLPEIQEIDAHKIIEAKLQEARKHNPLALVVEDTSLHFDCLNGLPGPLIKWFVKAIDNEGLATLADKMGNPKAQAVTLVGYVDEGGLFIILKVWYQARLFMTAEEWVLVGIRFFCLMGMI